MATRPPILNIVGKNSIIDEPIDPRTLNNVFIGVKKFNIQEAAPIPNIARIGFAIFIRLDIDEKKLFDSLSLSGSFSSLGPIFLIFGSMVVLVFLRRVNKPSRFSFSSEVDIYFIMSPIPSLICSSMLSRRSITAPFVSTKSPISLFDTFSIVCDSLTLSISTTLSNVFESVNFGILSKFSR